MFIAHSYSILKFFELHNVPVRPNIHTTRIDSLSIILLVNGYLIVLTNGYIGGFVIRYKLLAIVKVLMLIS